MYHRRFWDPQERQSSGEPVKNIGRVNRTLKLIVFLSEWRTIKECAIHIEVHERTIQRYIKMFINLGFKVHRRTGRFYAHRIINIEEYFLLNRQNQT